MQLWKVAERLEHAAVMWIEHFHGWPAQEVWVVNVERSFYQRFKKVGIKKALHETGEVQDVLREPLTGELVSIIEDTFQNTNNLDKTTAQSKTNQRPHICRKPAQNDERSGGV
jgi:hypothetical protein